MNESYTIYNYLTILALPLMYPAESLRDIVELC